MLFDEPELMVKCFFFFFFFFANLQKKSGIP